jgi:hypothetical protein
MEGLGLGNKMGANPGRATGQQYSLCSFLNLSEFVFLKLKAKLTLQGYL